MKFEKLENQLTTKELNKLKMKNEKAKCSKCGNMAEFLYNGIEVEYRSLCCFAPLIRD